MSISKLQEYRLCKQRTYFFPLFQQIAEYLHCGEAEEAQAAFQRQSKVQFLPWLVGVFLIKSFANDKTFAYTLLFLVFWINAIYLKSGPFQQWLREREPCTLSGPRKRCRWFYWSQQNSSLAFLQGEPWTVFVPPELVCQCAVLCWGVSSDSLVKRQSTLLKFETFSAKYPVTLQEWLHQSQHSPLTPKMWCARLVCFPLLPWEVVRGVWGNATSPWYHFNPVVSLHPTLAAPGKAATHAARPASWWVLPGWATLNLCNSPANPCMETPVGFAQHSLSSRHRSLRAVTQEPTWSDRNSNFFEFCGPEARLRIHLILPNLESFHWPLQWPEIRSHRDVALIFILPPSGKNS